MQSRVTGRQCHPYLDLAMHETEVLLLLVVHRKIINAGCLCNDHDAQIPSDMVANHTSGRQT